MPGKTYQPIMHQKNLASVTVRQSNQLDSKTIMKAINQQESYLLSTTRTDVALRSICRQLAHKNRLTTPVATKLLRYGQGRNAYRRLN